MKQKAIIDTQTGVVKRLTTDESPSLNFDESIVMVADNFDTEGKFVKVDQQGNKLIPTREEIEDSGVDEDFNAVKRSERIKNLKEIVVRLSSGKIVDEDLALYFSLLSEVM